MPEIEFYTEQRGGYDEWSDPWEQVVEVSIDGEHVPKFPDRGVFQSAENNARPLDVEFPNRPHKPCSIEIYEPTYVGWQVNKNTLQEALVDNRTIDLQKLGSAEYGNADDVLRQQQQE